MKLFMVLFSLVFMVAFSCTNKPSTSDSGKDVQNQKAVLYVCPMHPEITSHKAGEQCSICGMNLVEKEMDEDEEGHSETDGKSGAVPSSHGKVNLSVEKRQLIGIRLGLVEKRQLYKKISAPGRVAFDPELYNAQAEYVAALRQWSQVQSSPLAEVKRSTREMIRSARLRLRVLGLSDNQIDRLGKGTSSGEGLLVGKSGKQNWIYAEVFEMDLPFVKPGLDVRITAPFLNNRHIEGKISAVDNVIDPQARTAKVRIKMVKQKESLRPETFVNVMILSPMGEFLAVPNDAIVDTGKETIVFVESKEGHYLPKEIQIGFRAEDYASVELGLSEGEKVVVRGNFLLDSESRLKGVFNRLSKNEHQH